MFRPTKTLLAALLGAVLLLGGPARTLADPAPDDTDAAPETTDDDESADDDEGTEGDNADAAPSLDDLCPAAHEIEAAARAYLDANITAIRIGLPNDIAQVMAEPGLDTPTADGSGYVRIGDWWVQSCDDDSAVLIRNAVLRAHYRAWITMTLERDRDGWAVTGVSDGHGHHR